MFYPQTMVEIEMIVPARDLIPVTKEIAGQGIFQQVDSSYLNSKSSPSVEDSWQEKAVAYSAVERRIQSVMQILNMDEGKPPKSDQTQMIEAEVAQPMIEPIEQEVHKVSDQLANEQKKVEQLASLLRQLEPVAGIDFDVSTLHQPQHIYTLLGIMPADNIERLQTSLERIPYVLLILHKDKQKTVAWLAGTQSNADTLERAARSAYLNPLILPVGQHGTPAEIIASIHQDVDHANNKISEHKTALNELQNTYKQKLQALLWRVRASHMLASAIERFGHLRYTYIIVGWIPSAALSGLTQRLKHISKELIIETNLSSRNKRRQDVPSSLANPGFLSSFQQLVTMFSHPRYEEIDPTFLIALTFPLLFGAMFGDVGHGLVLAALGGILVSKRVRFLRGLSSLGGLILACGLVATIFGFLYGSIFGLEDILPALWIRPMENITQILVIAIGVGIVLLSIGFLFGLLNAWTARDPGRFFFSHTGLAGLLFYWSLLGIVLKLFVKGIAISSFVFIIPAIITGLAVMFSGLLENLVDKHRPLIEGGLGTYAVQVFFEFFETLMSYLSNSLSYVRVGAFAVAHVGLSMVIFILAKLADPSHSVGYWIVFAIGTLFIVGFEGLIVGIQTMRLEYYEFFSKFFTGGGARFEPLTALPEVGKQS